jgi:hypothetical protein
VMLSVVKPCSDAQVVPFFRVQTPNVAPKSTIRSGPRRNSNANAVVEWNVPLSTANTRL